jgi:hypothetical protein
MCFPFMPLTCLVPFTVPGGDLRGQGPGEPVTGEGCGREGVLPTWGNRAGRLCNRKDCHLVSVGPVFRQPLVRWLHCPQKWLLITWNGASSLIREEEKPYELFTEH